MIITALVRNVITNELPYRKQRGILIDDLI